MNDSDYVIAVKLWRESTESLVMVKFDEPLHFSILHYHIKKFWPNWRVWFVFNMGDEATIEQFDKVE